MVWLPDLATESTECPIKLGLRQTMDVFFWHKSVPCKIWGIVVYQNPDLTGVLCFIWQSSSLEGVRAMSWGFSAGIWKGPVQVGSSFWPPASSFLPASHLADLKRHVGGGIGCPPPHVGQAYNLRTGGHLHHLYRTIGETTVVASLSQLFQDENRVGSRYMCCCSVAVVSDSFVILWTVALQAPLPMGFPRQEYWSGLTFPSPEGLPDPGK